jgi:hypothetical protein
VVVLKRAVGALEPVGIALMVILLFLIAFAGYWLDNPKASG